MKIKKSKVLLLIFIVTSAYSNLYAQPYTAEWASLGKVNPTPNWFMDAKFGIYTHWGPIATALEGADPSKAYRDWHGMFMYQDGVKVPGENGKPHNNYIHHTKKYGDPAQFGYKHVIEQFKPTKFDAKEWAELFVKSGAKFAGPVAIHHDNFAMWDSKATRWNSMNYGGIDPSAALKKEVEAHGIKYMASFHNDFTWKYYSTAHAYHTIDPKDYDLYTNPHSLESETPDKDFHNDWWNKLKEYIDKYQPDLLWFDWWLENLEEETRLKFLAYYYNQAQKWGKEVVVCYKENTFNTNVAVKDYERGRPNQPQSPAWLTDTSPGAWFFRPNAKFKSPNELIDILADIVAKNGMMLLNVPPDPDGSIPQVMVDLLTSMGAWLKVNGDAIYGTRPYAVYGEGPTRMPEGGHKVEKLNIVYTNKDIRYTKKSDKEIYAIVLDKPVGEIVMKTFTTEIGVLNSKILNITLLGSDEKLTWERNERGLVIQAPASLPTEYAHAFKITLEGYTENKIGGNVDAHKD